MHEDIVALMTAILCLREIKDDFILKAGLNLDISFKPYISVLNRIYVY